MKRCSRCGALKPLDAFHRNRQSRDGRRPDCRLCVNGLQRAAAQRFSAQQKSARHKARRRYNASEKGRVAEARYRSGPAGRARNRRRNGSAAGERARQRWVATPNGTLSRRQTAVRMRRLYPERSAARAAVYREVRAGRLTRPTACQRCRQSGGAIHAHHRNYAEPLNVTWLCRRCHTEEHRHS